MRIYKIGATYVGNCGNIFDHSTGDSLIDCFEDVSDFANKDENAIEIEKEDFDSFVKIIPSEVMEKTKGHILNYLFYDGNIYVIYDQNEDIHYFFY